MKHDNDKDMEEWRCPSGDSKTRPSKSQLTAKKKVECENVIFTWNINSNYNFDPENVSRMSKLARVKNNKRYKRADRCDDRVNPFDDRISKRRSERSRGWKDMITKKEKDEMKAVSWDIWIKDKESSPHIQECKTMQTNMQIGLLARNTKHLDSNFIIEHL